MKQILFTRKKSKITLLGILVFFLTGSNSVFAQTSVRGNSGPVLASHYSYGFFEPQADLADRFGGVASPSISVEYMHDNNWIVGAQGNFYFGSRVDEDPLSFLRNDLGYIYGTAEEPATITLRMRGIMMGGHVGRLFGIDPANSRNGIRVTLGAGFLQHKIRIQNDPQMPTPGLSGDYARGYDRLTNGLALTQFIGYQLYGKNRRTNFFFGLELTEAFTQNRRNADFDTGLAPDTKRTDVLAGLRLGWTLPFWLGEGKSGDLYY